MSVEAHRNGPWAYADVSKISFTYLLPALEPHSTPNTHTKPLNAVNTFFELLLVAGYRIGT